MSVGLFQLVPGPPFVFGALLVICALLVAAFIPEVSPMITGQLHHHSSTSRRPSGKYAYQKCTLQLTTIQTEKDINWWWVLTNWKIHVCLRFCHFPHPPMLPSAPLISLLWLDNLAIACCALFYIVVLRSRERCFFLSVYLRAFSVLLMDFGHSVLLIGKFMDTRVSLWMIFRNFSFGELKIL